MKSNFETVDWGDPEEKSLEAKLLAGELPEKWNQRSNLKLPTAAELAQIAACLPPEFNERERIEKALDLYFDSDEVLSEIKERMKDPNDLLMEYRSDEAVLKDIGVYDKTNSMLLETWEADYTKCPVRKFFKDNGYVIQKPNTVLTNILNFGGQGAEKRIEQAKRKTSKGIVYVLPNRLLEKVVAVRKKLKSESVSKGHKTRQQKNSGTKKTTRSRSKQK